MKIRQRGILKYLVVVPSRALFSFYFCFSFNFHLLFKFLSKFNFAYKKSLFFLIKLLMPFFLLFV